MVYKSYIKRIPCILFILLIISGHSRLYAWSTVNGVPVVTAAGDQAFSIMAADGYGGAIVLWDDYRSGNVDIYGQHLNSSGSRTWTTNGVVVCTSRNDQFVRDLLPDGQSGSFVLWEDYRGSNFTTADVYLQHLDSLGNSLWTFNGFPVSTVANDQLNPQMTVDANNGVIMAWGDDRNFSKTSSFDIYAQRIDHNGNVKWASNGIAVCTSSFNQKLPFVCTDKVGGAFICWQDFRVSTDTGIYMQHVNSSGAMLWPINGVKICTTISYKSNPYMVSDGSGGAYLLWWDARGNIGSWTLMAQHVNSNGTSLLPLAGLPISNPIKFNTIVWATQIPDNSGGTILGWGVASSLTISAYAQRLNSGGTTLWTAGGVSICSSLAATYTNWSFSMVDDGLNGVYFAWHDFRFGRYDIFAQHLNASGNSVYPYNGFPICMAANNKYDPSIVSDGNHGCIIAWDDYRTGIGYDIYAQSINSTSPPMITGSAIYNDDNSSGLIDQGDTLTLQFDRTMTVSTSAGPADFYLANVGDTLGSGATVSVNSSNNTQVIVTLGSSPILSLTTIVSLQSNMRTILVSNAAAPSTIDISASMPSGDITDLNLNNALDGGVPGVDDSGYSILNTMESQSAFITAAGGGVAQLGSGGYYTKHKLTIPAGSLFADVTVSVGAAGVNHGKLNACTISPTTISFNPSFPAILTLEFKDSDVLLDKGYIPSGMRVHKYDANQGKYIPIPETYGKQSVDLFNHTVTVTLDSLTVLNESPVKNAKGGLQPQISGVQPWANIAIPTVDSKSYTVAPQSIAATGITLTVGTSGIYTKHTLSIPNYNTSVSGVNITLQQSSLSEKHDWDNNAVLKIVALSEPTTRETLTMEYKDHDDSNSQFTNDVIGGSESQMRIYRWRDDLNQWEKIAGGQTVDTVNNLVSVTIADALTTSQIYAVGVDDSATAPNFAHIPDLKLFKGQSLPSAFNLGDFNSSSDVATSYTLVNAFLGLSSVTGAVVYQSPNSSATSGSNFYSANNVIGASTTSNKVKFSTYKIKKLPQWVLRPGSSATVNVGAYAINSSGAAIPLSFGNASSLSSSDFLQVTAAWANSTTVYIAGLAGLISPQEIDVIAAPVTSNFGVDYDKERIQVYPALSTTAFEFSNASDTAIMAYQVPGGASGLPTITQLASVNDSSGSPSHGGVLKVTFGSASAGVKITPSTGAWLDNTPGQYYTLRVRVCGTSTTNNFLQVFYNGVPGATPADIVGYFKFSVPTNWATIDIPINSFASISSKVMYPQLVLKANGAAGIVYIDELEIFAATPTLLGASRNNTSDKYVGGYWTDPGVTTKWVIQTISGSANYSVSNSGLQIQTQSGSQNGLKFTASTSSGATYTIAANLGKQVGMHMNTHLIAGTADPTLSIVQVNVLGATSAGGLNLAGDIGAAAEFGRISNRTLHLSFPATNPNYQVQFIVKNAGVSTIQIDNTQADIDNDDPNYGDSTLYP